ncbi:MAG TPA: hypothetical protein VGI59_09900 [Candidatus Udaeobacter sp.]
MSRIAYPVGNTSVRDRAYWPTVLRSQITVADIGEDPNNLINHEYPASFTPLQYMKMCWRIREWDFSLDADLSRIKEATVVLHATLNIPFGSGIKFGFYAATDPFFAQGFVTRESQLLGAPDPPIPGDFLIFPAHLMENGLRNRGVAVGNYDHAAAAFLPGFLEAAALFPFFSPGDPPVTKAPTGSLLSADIGLFSMQRPAIWDPVAQLFYPVIDIETSYQVSFIGAGPQTWLWQAQAAAGAHFNAGLSYADGDLTLDFGDSTVVIPLKVADADTGHFHLKLKPSRWWPYSTSDGLPVYDETSGAVINDPFQ